MTKPPPESARGKPEPELRPEAPWLSLASGSRTLQVNLVPLKHPPTNATRKPGPFARRISFFRPCLLTSLSTFSLCFSLALVHLFYYHFSAGMPVSGEPGAQPSKEYRSWEEGAAFRDGGVFDPRGNSFAVGMQMQFRTIPVCGKG